MKSKAHRYRSITQGDSSLTHKSATFNKRKKDERNKREVREAMVIQSWKRA
jgi:hypothetical protein